MAIKKNLVFIVHYYPPINSSGAKRMEVLSRILAAQGRNITVITTQKFSGVSGVFSEKIPAGVNVIQLNGFGREVENKVTLGKQEPLFLEKPSFSRRIKNYVMRMGGQIPDPRLFFSMSFLYPTMPKKVKSALRDSEVIIGSMPPWTMVLAAFFASKRFKKKVIFDVRDQFSNCHEMPGSFFAKKLEYAIDRFLCKRSDAVVTISPPMKSYYEGMADRVEMVMNGYDADAINDARALSKTILLDDNKKLKIRYMGLVSPGRVPKNLISALSEYIAEGHSIHEGIQFEFYGHADPVKVYVEKNFPELMGFFVFYEPVPYVESLALMDRADYALFCETSDNSSLSAQGILTTKLFEYVGVGATILADISTHTLAGDLICKSGSHHYVENTISGFKEILMKEEFWNPVKKPVNEFGLSLSRQRQALQYSEIIDSL